MDTHGWDWLINDQITSNALSNVARLRGDGQEIFPAAPEIFKAFDLVSFSKVKVVILGQDPYPGTDRMGVPHAMGLAFSSKSTVTIPGALRNIFTELGNEYPNSSNSAGTGDLTGWAKQGVLLSNSSLTVEKGKPDSHKQIWRGFTHLAINALASSSQPVIFMLWGGKAKAYKSLIENIKGKNNKILEAYHPSNLSARRGFFGCNHFIEANNFLATHGLTEIDWARH